MNNESTESQRWFVVGCGLEFLLVAIGLAINAIFGRPLWADLHWSLMDVMWGLLASVPLLGLFWWVLRSNFRPFQRITEFMDSTVKPVFGPWSVGQLAVISLLAGVGEELLFRGAIQGGITDRFGLVPGLVVAGLLFGALHLITWTYGVLACGIGIYLGLLWVVGGNLLIPVVTHAVYDFVAFLYLFKMQPATDTREEEPEC